MYIDDEDEEYQGFTLLHGVFGAELKALALTCANIARAALGLQAPRMTPSMPSLAQIQQDLATVTEPGAAVTLSASLASADAAAVTTVAGTVTSLEGTGTAEGVATASEGTVTASLASAEAVTELVGDAAITCPVPALSTDVFPALVGSSSEIATASTDVAASGLPGPGVASDALVVAGVLGRGCMYV